MTPVPEVDRRAPVIVGVGQTSQRLAPDQARAPIDLLADAARSADADAGASSSLLARADVVAVVAIGSWRYADPGALLARKLGIAPRATAVSTVGGNSPQLLIDEFALRIQRGDCDVVLVGGAESMHTRWRARREPRVELQWESGDDPPCPVVIGDDTPGSSEYEMAHLAVAPTMVYPLFETALRSKLGHGVDEHQRYVSEMWSGFAEVAAGNPNARSRVAYTPEEIRTISPDNRAVCFPYPKRMCANIDVDQGAAVLLCSYEAARAAGVPDDRMVFLHAAAEAHDHWFVTERWSLAESPAIAATGAAVFEATGTGVDDIAHFDLYSCFPSAVQIGRAALGIAPDDRRPLTVTGGLGFAGGPVNNYPTHGIAAMVDRLRARPGDLGLTTALGWYVTKHTAAIWTTRPPTRPFERVNAQAAVDAQPAREPAGLVATEATIEATSIAFERDGTPSVGIVTAIADDGRRVVANARDSDMLGAMTAQPWEGRRVKFGNDGTTNTIAG
ncbi:MAG: acetyl-CoA acetyltransferase [Actinomycetia bacterium]|nr:acetyl-CoA acetyltransferase [Actinomycetes bacterium]